MPLELAGANITHNVARIASRDDIDQRWLLYAAKSQPVFAQLDQLSLGAAVRRIDIFDLKRARVPMPPREIQQRIANELDVILQKLRLLSEHTAVHIDRLRDYRSSLIPAALTGRLDIDSFGEAS